MSENDEQKPAFDHWAIVEIMGHQTYAGRATEETIAGVQFIRVDVPEIPERTERGVAYDYEHSGKRCQERTAPAVQAFTKFFGAASIYCITPCTEDVVRKAAESRCSRKVSVIDLGPAEPEALIEAASEEFDLSDGSDEGAF